MVNVSAIRAEMARNGMTIGDVARELGVSNATLSRKLSRGVFGTDEASRLVEILKISNPADIFFAERVTL